MESKHYLVSMLHPPCLPAWTEIEENTGINVPGLGLFKAWLWQKHQIKPGNSHVVETDKAMMPPIELLKRWHQISSLVSLRQQSCSELSSSLDNVLILSVGSISCCRVLIVVSSLYSFDFYVLGDVHWWVRNPSCGLNKCLVYTTAELRARVVAT